MSAFFARRFAGRGLGLGLGLGFAAPALVRHAQCNRAPTEGENDPHLWLEEIEGEAPLTWVKENNKRIGQVLGDIEATKAYKDILAIADSKDKIPFVQRIGGKTSDEDAKVYYNFWQDATHKRGVWRRTSYNGYKSASPEWETVLSVDDLNTAEQREPGNEWVWGSVHLLDEGPKGSWDRCLVKLSPGGKDAKVIREFDLATKTFVEGGFVTTEPNKLEVNFRRRDELLIGTDFDGTGASLTDSGYPRVIKSWKRGTPLSSAVTVFEGDKADVAVSQYVSRERGGVVHEFIHRAKTFYTSEVFYRAPDLSKAAHEDQTPFRKVPIPEDTSLGTFGDQATLELRSEWAPPKAPGGKSYPGGTLLTAPLEDVMAGDWSKVTVLFTPPPDSSSSLQGTTFTANFVVLNVSTHLKESIQFFKYSDANAKKHGGGGPHAWLREGSGAPASLTVPVGFGMDTVPIWPDDSDDLWLRRQGFLEPLTLSKASATDGCATADPLKSMPKFFDASNLVVEQHFVTSKDGTRVPYFLLGPKDMKLDGSHITLLDGYGGFEISETPHYSGAVGAAWLTRGCVKVVSNIRGGGEYGPQWHQAALREKRHRCYEDFEAIAQDLIERGVTRKEKLACIGGSNGGLLMGNMITRHGRELFGACVCQVPLLDMARYHKLLAGASWVEEFGNPEEEGAWDSWLASISAYHRLRGFFGYIDQPKEHSGQGVADLVGPDWPGAPRTLFTTSTKDDRVHPGHARKMVKALQDEVPVELGGGTGNILYWENIEGGHGGAADNKQRAHMWALTYEFLIDALSGKR